MFRALLAAASRTEEAEMLKTVVAGTLAEGRARAARGRVARAKEAKGRAAVVKEAAASVVKEKAGRVRVVRRVATLAGREKVAKGKAVVVLGEDQDR